MEETLFQLAAVLVLGIVAQWLSWRIRFPSILLLLSLGFLMGPVLGYVRPDYLFGPILIPFVSMAVALILFEGGLSLAIRDLHIIGRVVTHLVTVGALFTFGFASLGAVVLLDLDTSLAILLGAILVVTGPTVVIPLLRHIRPKGDIGKILRWEGIVIDPVGATLAVLVFEVIRTSGIQGTTLAFVEVIFVTLLVGSLVGVAGAALLVLLMKRNWIPDFLHNSVTLAFVLGSFVVSNHFQEESGFLTVTIMGVALASQKQVSIKHVVEFKENLQVLLLGTLFIVLSARLEVEDLYSVNLPNALLFLTLLVFVARPVSVLVSTFRSDLTWQERAFLCWMAPRGIVAASVSAIFALRLSELGFRGSEQLVPLTFITIVGTILLYGITSLPLARRLGIAQKHPNGYLIIGAHSWAQEIARVLQENGVDVLVADSNWRNISEARMAGLRTYYGNVLTHQVLDELDLDGIGNLLALTSNDEVNSLCSLHFSEVFGRYSVFQIPLDTAQVRETDAVSQPLHGQFVFSSDLTFRRLRALFLSGASTKSTRLSPTFTFDSMKREGFSGTLLFVIRGGKAEPVRVGEEADPKPGDTVISLLTD